MSLDLTQQQPSPTLAAPPSAFDKLVSTPEEDDVSLAARDLLTFYDERYAAALTSLQGLTVTIDKDPVAGGLQRFNHLISSVRVAANYVAPWLSAVVADRNAALERFKAAKAAYEEKLDLTLAHNEEVRDLAGSFEAKKALARDLCKRDKRIVDYAEQIYRRLSAYYDAIKIVYDNLNATNGDLMKQLAVVKQQIALGEADPNRFPVDRGGVGPPTSPLQEAEREVSEALDVKEGLVEFG